MCWSQLTIKLPLDFDKDFETAVDHASGVERQSLRVHHASQARIFITLALTRSRCARDLNTIQENITVSFGFSLTLCGNDVSFPIFTSSPMRFLYWLF